MIELKNEAASVFEKRKCKFNKKVTWSVQLETVKMLTPDSSQSQFKFQVFSVKEEELGSFPRKESLWYLEILCHKYLFDIIYVFWYYTLHSAFSV